MEQLTHSLDLFSISQKGNPFSRAKPVKNDRRVYDVCQNKAPFFAYQITGKKWGVVQGCCNDWNCPRCGQQRAREEYGRIVAGAREMGKTNQLTMFTVTCRGRDLSVKAAEEGYLVWTNRLLSRLRAQTKSAGRTWAYASVTERQERQHPHSHYLTTFRPPDALFVEKGKPKFYYTQNASYPAKHDTLQSEIVEKACTECGLGWQYDISDLGSVEGASRYVAKYLFKASIFDTVWPKKWRRVRYSQNWPKLPEMKGNAIVLLSKFDWYKLGRLATVILTKDDGVQAHVKAHLSDADVIIQ